MKYTALGVIAVLSVSLSPAEAQTYVFDTSPVVYSPTEYPSAQGQYLVLPKAQAVAVAQPTYYQPAQPVTQRPMPQPVYVESPAIIQAPAAPVVQPTYVPMKPRTVVAAPMAYKLDALPKISLGTLNGFEFGAQGSWYHYQEHVVANQEFMHIEGGKGGLTVDANKVFHDGTFIGANARGAYGHENYTGGDMNLLTGQTIPSKHDDEDDMLLEGRLLAGHDFVFDHYQEGNFSLSPYAGFGVRFLYNNASGQDSNGVNGYKRYSQYLYLPVGVTPRFRLTDDSRISINTEYDHLIYGWQVSQLADSQPGSRDLVNNQYDGYGLKASAMYERAAWSVGPFFNYWNINQSNSGCARYAYYYIACGFEPHNQTMEYGLQVRYRLGMPWWGPGAAK